jgi:hypothetical protein
MVWSCKNKEAQEPDDKDIPEVAVVPVEKPVVSLRFGAGKRSTKRCWQRKVAGN